MYLGACHTLCLARTTAPPEVEGSLFAILGVLLVLDSLASVIAPRAVFFVSALLAALIDLLEVVNHSTIVQTTFYVTVVLVTVSLVLSLASALKETTVSEQSHPMNLPVFG